MKTTHILIATGVILFAACGQASKENTEYKSEYNNLSADSTTVASASSSAAKESNEPHRKFIRTADLKFKVKDVVKSSYSIEDIVAKNGGFVTYTNLSSHVDYTNTTAISKDSLLESVYYTVYNSITLRVPNSRLDTTLKEIAGNIDFLDSRLIKAEDVALQILANNLSRKRAARNEERLERAIDKRGKKLNETTNAEEVLSGKYEESDQAYLQNLSLNDQISYSTVTLSIYQRQAVKYELIADSKNIKAYEPGFGAKLLDSFKFGWNMLTSFVLILANFWTLIVIVIIGYLLLKKWKSTGKH